MSVTANFVQSRSVSEGSVLEGNPKRKRGIGPMSDDRFVKTGNTRIQSCGPEASERKRGIGPESDDRFAKRCNTRIQNGRN